MHALVKLCQMYSILIETIQHLTVIESQALIMQAQLIISTCSSPHVSMPYEHSLMHHCALMNQAHATVSRVETVRGKFSNIAMHRDENEFRLLDRNCVRLKLRKDKMRQDKITADSPRKWDICIVTAARNSTEESKSSITNRKKKATQQCNIKTTLYNNTKI